MGLFDFLKKKEFQEIEQLRNQLEKYKPITTIEVEVENQKKVLESLISNKQNEIQKVESDYDKLNADYKAALETYTKLRKEVSIFENKLDLIELNKRKLSICKNK
jgi:predicted  nucleic acid-binding Zn-ribbon protein